MLRLLTVLLVVSVNVFAEDQTDPFQAGLASYQRHDFAAARDQFRAAVERGPVTARLLHNLALAHFQANERARALAYWRKALAIDPAYPAALVGRELLENHMNMRPFEKDGVELSVRRALDRVPAFPTSWALAALLAAFAWTLLRHLSARRSARDEDRAGPGRPVAAVLTGTLSLAVAGLLAVKLYYGMTLLATVVAEQAGAKSLPNDESATLFTLPPGGEVKVRRRADEWAQVQTSDGGTGWVRASDIVVTSEM